MEIYKQTSEYAREHGEMGAYRVSLRENRACKEAIERAIEESFDGMNLPRDTARKVMEQMGKERVLYVLANTVQCKVWDGRFSRSNKAWADTFDIPGDAQKGDEHRFVFVVNAHPAVLDGFIDQARRAEREAKKSSVLEALKTPKAQRTKPVTTQRHEEER